MLGTICTDYNIAHKEKHESTKLSHSVWRKPTLLLQSLAKMQGVEKEKSSNYYKSCLNVEVDVINVVYVWTSWKYFNHEKPFALYSSMLYKPHNLHRGYVHISQMILDASHNMKMQSLFTNSAIYMYQNIDKLNWASNFSPLLCVIFF